MSLTNKVLSATNIVLSGVQYCIDSMQEFLDTFYAGLLWNEVVNRKKFKTEVQFLKNYFNTHEGIQLLMNLFFQAETCDYDEPAAFIDPASGKNEIVLSEQKKKWLEGFVVKDKKVLEELIDEVKSQVNNAESANEKGANYNLKRFLSEELPKHLNSTDESNNFTDVYVALKTHLSGWNRVKKDDEKPGIKTHIHPNKEHIFRMLDGEYYSFTHLKGYSPADRICSRDKSIGLVEYQKRVDFSEKNNPKLVIDFDVLHRIQSIEKRIGLYKVTLDLDGKLEILLDDGTKKSAKINKRKLPKDQTINLLCSSMHALPFVEYDENEQFAVKTYPDNSDNEKLRQAAQRYKEALESVEKILKPLYQKTWVKQD